MADRDSFASLEERLRSGEDTAAREVFGRFSRQLIVLASRQIDPRLAHRVEAEDVVQSAFKSFFIRQREGKFQIGGWNALWNLMTLITLRKCADRIQYLKAERRDVDREVSAPAGQEQPWELALDREPRPEEAAMLAETVEALFRAVDADERPILELSLQGYSAAEIAIQLGRALRTVQRLREQIRKRVERDAERISRAD